MAMNCFILVSTAESIGLSGATPSSLIQGWPSLWNKEKNNFNKLRRRRDNTRPNRTENRRYRNPQWLILTQHLVSCITFLRVPNDHLPN
jgi:hypothetical protein